jgi:alpha-ketoglutarate-dependent taurine dioxygenase
VHAAVSSLGGAGHGLISKLRIRNQESIPIFESPSILAPSAPLRPKWAREDAMDLTMDRTDQDALASAQAQFGSQVVCSTPYAPRPPLWIEPADGRLATDGSVARSWMGEHHDDIEAALLTFGAIVFRGFPVQDTDDFAALMADFTPFAAGYAGGTTDRKAIKGQVMEATRTSEELYILLHQEMSYMEQTPRLVAFYCKTPSEEGGETVICDMRGVLETLPEALQKKFIDEGVAYRRNLRSEAVDDWRADPKYRHPSWQYRFDTDSAEAVSAQLAERGVSFEWLADGSLNMWTCLPGVTTHPVTGDVLLFNQLHAQHQHRFLIGDARADLMDAAYGTTIPRPYFPTFGGGDALTDDEYFAIQDELESRLTRFTWRSGDMMLVENKLTGHGRKPYRGARDIQVMLLD